MYSENSIKENDILTNYAVMISLMDINLKLLSMKDSSWVGNQNARINSTRARELITVIIDGSLVSVIC